MMEISMRNHPNWQRPYSAAAADLRSPIRSLIPRDDWMVGAFRDSERHPPIQLTSADLDRFGAIAMGFHGLIKLIEAEGFDEATGAREILQMVYRDFVRLIEEIRVRAEEDSDIC